MLASEKLAIAAHLHVLLRRKTGRITDPEWMASNVAYATEIVRFSRERAQTDGHPDLAEWAAKLESAVLPPVVNTSATSISGTAAAPAGPAAADPASRYVRGIR
jgi:hypothetical protein